MKPIGMVVVLVAACAGTPGSMTDAGHDTGGAEAQGGAGGTGGSAGAGGTGGTGGAGGAAGMDAGRDEGILKDAPTPDGSGATTPGGMCATFAFPTFDKSCSSDSDCVVVEHQINCCGTFAAWGISAADKTAFDDAEATCERSYPGCGCAATPTKADDGKTSVAAGDIGVGCTAGVCLSFIK